MDCQQQQQFQKHCPKELHNAFTHNWFALPIGLFCLLNLLPLYLIVGRICPKILELNHYVVNHTYFINEKPLITSRSSIAQWCCWPRIDQSSFLNRDFNNKKSGSRVLSLLIDIDFLFTFYSSVLYYFKARIQ